MAWKPLIALGLLVIGVGGGDWARAQDPLAALKNFKIDGLVRFRDSRQAEATRDQLIHSIWPGGLPTTRPKVSEASVQSPEIQALDKSLVGTVRLFDVNISDFDWHSTVIVVTPARNPIKRIGIVHGGHMPEGPAGYLASGLGDSANELLRAGYVVALIHMPLVAWNQDNDGVVAGKDLKVAQRSVAGHNELFDKIEPTLKAGTMRFFLEPITQTINELLIEMPTSEQVLMIGLSGGGWTTHLIAAVETRIDVSLPVAGAFPIYARSLSRGSMGDAEQIYTPIFGEKDSDSDGITDTATGIASWLEVFALGGIAPNSERPRKQIQILNLYDSCCFHGEVYKSYAPALTEWVRPIRSSHWSVFIDDSHRDHMISPHAIKEVLRSIITDGGSDKRSRDKE